MEGLWTSSSTRPFRTSFGGRLLGERDRIFLIPNPVDGLSPKTFLGIFSLKEGPLLRIFAYVLLVGERSSWSWSWSWLSSSKGREREEHPAWIEGGSLVGDCDRDWDGGEGDNGRESRFNVVSDEPRPSGFSGVDKGSLIRLYPNPAGCISSDADFTVAAAHEPGWKNMAKHQ